MTPPLSPYPYTGRMARYKGPCANCGTYVDRTIRPERLPLCHPCAIHRANMWNLTMAQRTNPAYEASVKAGQETARQIRERSGPQFERWRTAMLAGMARIEASLREDASESA